MDATSAPDMLQVMQYLDQFYTTSWNHLLICGSVAVGIVGVVIPILIQIYQRRTMRHERSQIREAMVGQVSTAVHNLMEQEKALLEEKIEAGTKSLEERLARDRAELEERVRKTEVGLRRGIAGASGTIFHVQTNSLIERKEYEAAFTSGMIGLSDFVEGEDHLNLRRLLQVISERCLPGMKKAQLDEMEEDKKVFHGVMAKIKKWDVNNDFADAVAEAKRAFKAACERVPPVKA